MPFSYDTEIKDGYLLVTSQGSPSSPDEFFEYIRSSIMKARVNGLNRVVFDETAANLHFKVYDAVLMSDRLEQEGLQTLGIRAAVVCNPDDLAACKYFETSLRNRAFNVMMFDMVEKGKDWLLREH